MMATPNNVAIAQLNKDFSLIAVIVDEMKKINSEWDGLDNAEYYEELGELAEAAKKALQYFEDKMEEGSLGPDVE